MKSPLWQVLGCFLLLLFWYGLSFSLGKTVVPLPHGVILLFFRLVLSGELLLHSGASLFRLLAGIFGALILGVPLGILAGTSRWGERLISPVVYLLYPLPKIAFLPLFMILFGLGNLSKIILLFSVVLFQIILAARDGVKNIPESYHRVARLHELGGKERFLKLYLPSTLPGLFSAMRISTGIGMAVLFFAENYAARYGLGYFIMNNWIMIYYEGMFAGILMLALTALLLLMLIDFLENRLCPWNNVGINR
jgi:ABC-type nitrate/sulfonate/bicarbonate transport system permease component